MDENRIGGAERGFSGRMKAATGGVLGDSKLQADGDIDQIIGRLQGSYGQAMDQARQSLTDLNVFVKEQPWMALAAAAGAGALVGLVLGRSGRRVVYVRKVKHSEVL